ncbi:ABC transporter ATP-binding protein [Actinomadura spongiicola]|uniref:ABC transporter ATP-binding protein n=1 Tax=Actinomadura spongiicola TaxID=2303421 RepID=A0A372GCY1_9ACTN|nr:ABC transporter ATP-binding protein [Actinomadura spongiicola]RFS83032.1 ABC transporter ATP-binding protein [Actinomadura spongiicola]
MVSLVLINGRAAFPPPSPRPSPPPSTGGPDGAHAAAVCVADGLTRSFPGASRPAVESVTLAVRPGEVFGVLGRNGAGKSTLVRLLMGLLRPDRGTVRLMGADVTAHAARAAAHVAYLPQRESALGDMDVRTAVETTARLRGMSRVRARAQRADVLAELGLTGLAGKRVARLSGGQRRLVGVAAALVADRPLLVLDEPTTGLDLDARRAVWDAIERRRDGDGTSVVLVTHDVREAETVLDRVLVLSTGRTVACDTPGLLKEGLGGLVRLELAWRDDPPIDARDIADHVAVRGRRWSVRLPVDEARRALDDVLAGPAYAALDDFVLAPPSLEDVLLADGIEEDR